MTEWVIMWIECYVLMARPVFYTLFYIQLPPGGKTRKYKTHFQYAPCLHLPYHPPNTGLPATEISTGDGHGVMSELVNDYHLDLRIHTTQGGLERSPLPPIMTSTGMGIKAV